VKVYLASKLENAPAVEAFATELLALDVEITSRWHKPYTPRPREDTITDAHARQIAENNFFDLAYADALVLLPYPGMRGALIELGYALGAGIPAFVLGTHEHTSLMSMHSSIWFGEASAEQIAAMLRAMRRR
jgi:nucleoside 2-deoxyribosyltransferase